MTGKNQSAGPGGKIVLAGAGKTDDGDGNLFFLFTAGQIEEVLVEVDACRPSSMLGFADGLCRWRGNEAPLVDIGKLFGFSGAGENRDERFLIVRCGVSENRGEKKIIRCVLRISSQIQTMEIPSGCMPVTTDRLPVDKSLVRGVYQWEDNLLIVPDMSTILLNKTNIQ